MFVSILERIETLFFQYWQFHAFPSKHKDVLKSSFLVSNWSGRLCTRKRRLKDVFLGTSFNLSQQDVLKPSYTCLKKNQFKLVSARRLEVVSILCF